MADKPVPEWPAKYKAGPQSLTNDVGGGANYSAADLAAFKAKHAKFLNSGLESPSNQVVLPPEPKSVPKVEPATLTSEGRVMSSSQVWAHEEPKIRARIAQNMGEAEAKMKAFAQRVEDVKQGVNRMGAAVANQHNAFVKSFNKGMTEAVVNEGRIFRYGLPIASAVLLGAAAFKHYRNRETSDKHSYAHKVSIMEMPLEAAGIGFGLWHANRTSKLVNPLMAQGKFQEVLNIERQAGIHTLAEMAAITTGAMATAGMWHYLSGDHRRNKAIMAQGRGRTSGMVPTGRRQGRRTQSSL